VSDRAAALDVVGARWALLIVERLLDGPQRYGDLQRELGVPTNMLVIRLRELEAAGVLSRLPLLHNTRAYALKGGMPCARRSSRSGTGPRTKLRYGTHIVRSQFEAGPRIASVPAALAAPDRRNVEFALRKPSSEW
jgi:DNA-binding Lrp family transcriptional regulator